VAAFKNDVGRWLRRIAATGIAGDGMVEAFGDPGGEKGTEGSVSRKRADHLAELVARAVILSAVNRYLRAGLSGTRRAITSR
jgi:hypothetical protein